MGPAVRRAELVGIPSGTELGITMPDGHQLIVRYMGEVASFSQLPRNPNWSDMWKVTESGASWVWYMPSGFSGPAWVDP